MYKKFLKKVLLLLLILLVSITLSNCAYSSKEKGGYFKKIRTDYQLQEGFPIVKLKDGRIFLTALKLFFDPKTNTFRKTTQYPKNVSGDAILLNNGKILFFEYYLPQPSNSDPLKSKLINLFYDDYIKKLIKEDIGYDMPFELLTLLEQTKYKKQLRDEYYKKSEKDRAAIYMPYLKKNPELLKKYNDYLAERENRKYAWLFDPETETFEKIGKTIYLREDTLKTLLKDGRVFLTDNYGKNIEIYDPEDGQFKALNTEAPDLFFTFRPQASIKIKTLNNGNIFLWGSKYTIYDVKNNTFSSPKPFPLKSYSNFLMLKDDKILLFTGGKSVFLTKELKNFPNSPAPNSKMYAYYWEKVDATEIMIFDIKKEEISYVGHLAIPRGGDVSVKFSAVELKDGRILIFGGEKDYSNRRLGAPAKELKEAEILDLKTGKSTLLNNKMNFSRVNDDAILLDDGRVLIYGCNNYYTYSGELFIPR